MADRPETYLTQTDFSKQIGFTRQAISKAVGTGVLRQVEFEGNKYIDIESVLTKSYIKEARTKKTGQSLKTKTIPKKKVGQSKSKKKSQNKQVGQSKGSINDGIVDPSQSFNPNDIPQYIKDLANSEHLSFEQLYQLPKVDMDKLKIYEQIKQIRVKTKKERKELIDSKFIKIVLGKLYEIDINEFMEIKTRMKPHFSKVFKTNDDKTLLEAEGILDKELWETLKRIKFEIDKFIDKWSDKKK